MIDVGGVKSFIAGRNTIQCKDYDQRSVVLGILRECGLEIGFDEPDYPDHFYVSCGSFHTNQIHCGKRTPIWRDSPIISGMEFLQTFCGWGPEHWDRDFTPPTMAEIETLYHIESKHLML